MIRYSLMCELAHEFEGWFRNSGDFDKQCALRLVTCPHCGSGDIHKRLMAPSVSTSRAKEARKQEAAGPVSEAAPAVSESSSAPAPVVSAETAVAVQQASAMLAANPAYREMLESLKTIRRKVIESSENVGSNFAEEARKIHYGEAEERNIYGQTSPQDARDLLDEGISVLPLPELPDDKN
ncbi:DUF1178 family protein [Roseibium suaedae]|uniref:DUF1178 family protein n=1 Tax=Roseibium suaedae TaxID=735517 RepID=A0A1M7NAL5_9HYPH|nr:DUF1178 family protein [Roseibium suaedae]SHN00632.1 hypothetical protein SAMN05444272_3786 [Roseibium suaedae]